MAPKTCFFLLVGSAIIVCTVTASCIAPSSFEQGNTVQQLDGLWYAQGMYVDKTKKKNQVNCMKSQYTFGGGLSTVNNTIKTPCGISEDVEITLTPESGGSLTLKRAGGYRDMSCYILSQQKDEHQAVYCCATCKSSKCESLVYYTKDAELKPAVLVKMNNKAKAAGLSHLASEVKYVSGNACFRK